MGVCNPCQRWTLPTARLRMRASELSAERGDLLVDCSVMHSRPPVARKGGECRSEYCSDMQEHKLLTLFVLHRTQTHTFLFSEKQVVWGGSAWETVCGTNESHLDWGTAQNSPRDASCVAVREELRCLPNSTALRGSLSSLGRRWLLPPHRSASLRAGWRSMGGRSVPGRLPWNPVRWLRR